MKAVNIAARLQSIANEAEILISAETFYKLQHQIDAEMLPPVQIKGIDEPITVYRKKS